MTNEQLVEEIKNGHSVTENMQLLYERNLPLIKRMIKPYTAYENTEDLGLFGYTQQAKIENIHITNANINGDYVGAIAGYLNASGLSGCTASDSTLQFLCICFYFSF